MRVIHAPDLQDLRRRPARGTVPDRLGAVRVDSHTPSRRRHRVDDDALQVRQEDTLVITSDSWSCVSPGDPGGPNQQDPCSAPHQQLRVGRVRHTVDMAESIPLGAVVPPLQSLVRHAARNRERITITDQDEPAAVVISAEELEDLEDALAVAEARLREASGNSRRFPQAEVRRCLGLER